MQTTDPQDELFYQVDENDTVIGSVKRHDAHHNPNIIHRASHVVIFNTHGEILLQQRSLTKDKYPGFWVDAASGHVEFGSDYLTTIIKETREEIGIDIRPHEIDKLGKILVKNELESEYVTFYKFITDKKAADLKVSEDEVINVEFFTIKQIKKMLNDPKEKIVPITREILQTII